MPLLNEDESAFAAWHWSNGVSQIKMAKWFRRSNAYICISISEFIKKHSNARTDNFGRLLDNEMPRQKLAGIVSENFYKHSGMRKVRVRVKAKSVHAANT